MMLGKSGTAAAVEKDELVAQPSALPEKYNDACSNA